MIAESAMAGETLKLAQQALAQQEADLLEAAVREHSRLVYCIAYSVLRNPADAEDATQEVFLRVLRYGKKIARIADQKAWLARIAWRVAVGRRKKIAKAGTDSEEPVESLVSRGHGADRILLEQERTAVLDRLISALPSPLRDVLVLSTLEEIAPREVASMLGISEAAVRSRSFRAREILRDRLLALNGPGTWI
ncbi:MAG: RNA polymerase sigma factor [Terriglobales bacterium]